MMVTLFSYEKEMHTVRIADIYRTLILGHRTLWSRISCCHFIDEESETQSSTVKKWCQDKEATQFTATLHALWMIRGLQVSRRKSWLGEILNKHFLLYKDQRSKPSSLCSFPPFLRKKWVSVIWKTKKECSFEIQTLTSTCSRTLSLDIRQVYCGLTLALY